MDSFQFRVVDRYGEVSLNETQHECQLQAGSEPMEMSTVHKTHAQKVSGRAQDAQCEMSGTSRECLSGRRLSIGSSL